MVEATGQRQLRLSIRTLMIAVALCAVLLVLLVFLSGIPNLNATLLHA
jgi:hypothetical protein